jgi:hypothetical protein
MIARVPHLVEVEPVAGDTSDAATNEETSE